MKSVPLWILFFFLFVTSCTVYREFPIEVYKPGEIVIPPNVENISLVYRNFKYENDTARDVYKRDFELVRAKNDPENLDSVLVNYCFDEFKKNIKTNTHIQNITVVPGIFKNHSGEKMPKLSDDLIDQISQVTGSDLIVSLETYFYLYSEFTSNGSTPESKEVITGNVWAVYDPLANKTLNRQTVLETVYWNN